MESVEDDDDHQTPETNAQEDVFPPSGMPGFSLREEVYIIDLMLNVINLQKFITVIWLMSIFFFFC